MRWGIWALAAVALTGCASSADQSYADFKACQALGYQPGSPAYWQCRNGVESDRAANRQAIAASIGQLGQTLRDAGAAPVSTQPAAMPESIQGGLTQVCLYDTIQGPVAVNARATAICPIYPPR